MGYTSQRMTPARWKTSWSSWNT